MHKGENVPTCIECGFVASRLQWTHFKYKCTGKFSNGREYQNAYPDAQLVDDDLKKKTAITFATLTKKYGEVDGKLRWENYRKKQAVTNSFEYKKQKYGWSREDFKKYNQSRASTFNNMIDRYGEVDDAIKWQLYCDRQAFTNTSAYFVEKYGEVDGIRQYNETNSMKAHTVENMQRVHNCTLEKAKQILESRNVSLAYSSNLEKIIINDLEKRLQRKLQYSINTKQYCVWGNNKPNFYDIVDNNVAIEVNGDYWHCNPNKYEGNYCHPSSQQLAEEIWNRDQQKINLLFKLRNIPTLVIWESEYLENKEEVITKCTQWIQAGKK